MAVTLEATTSRVVAKDKAKESFFIITFFIVFVLREPEL
jgi:hypothetical protein